MAESVTEQIRVVIVHECSVVRAGLRLLLEKQGRIAVVVEVEKLETLVEAFREDVLVQLAVVELSTPLRMIREVVRWLQRERGIPVLAYGAMTDRIADELVEEGVCGLLPPNVEADELQRACLVASAGGYHANPWFKGRFKKGRRGAKPKRGTAEPTARQLEALEWFCKGLTLEQTAAKMNIGRRGVETHRDELFEKFGVRKISALVSEAIKRGVIK